MCEREDVCVWGCVWVFVYMGVWMHIFFLGFVAINSASMMQMHLSTRFKIVQEYSPLVVLPALDAVGMFGTFLCLDALANWGLECVLFCFKAPFAVLGFLLLVFGLLFGVLPFFGMFKPRRLATPASSGALGADAWNNMLEYRDLINQKK